MEIPKQLQTKGIRFVLIEKGTKKPYQLEWQNKNIEFDNEELINHLKKGGNYGVMGGGEKQLIILDFDNLKLQEELCGKLPKTFTVKTGSGLLHKYFFSDKNTSFKIFNDEMDTLADVQGEGKQVVGAGSIHPNGNKYEVIDDCEISFISWAELKALLSPYDKKPLKEKKELIKPKLNIEDNFIDNLKNSLSIEEVLNSFGIDTSINPTQCPFHSSKGGKCLGFNSETAHCFHCDGSWNIFSLVKEIKNCDFKEALEYLSNLAGMTEELELSRRKYLEMIEEKNKTDKRITRDLFLDLIKEKKWGESAEILVDYILRNRDIYTIKDDIKTEIWVYNKGIYIPNGKSEVKEILRDLLGKYYSNFHYNQVIAKLEPDTFIDSKDFFSNNYINEIPVNNGILNIFTKELKEFSSEKIFFNKLPVEYNIKAECPQIDKFLSEVLSCSEDKEVFYEICGFCLYKEYKFEKAFMFIGNGRNGKDKSLELIKRLLGINNCCSVPLVSLDLKNFIISEFFGKMVNIAGEISNHDLKDTAGFKALTGRSLISAQRKFLNSINFINHAKFIFACNELPMVYDNSKGFWDRWVLLEFPYTFVTKEEIENNKDNDKLKLRDESIIEKITTPSEMSGFLNKCLEGLNRLMINKKFSSTKGSEEIKQLWVRKSNSFMAFCMDCIESEYDAYITKKELRKKYSEYCKNHKLQVKTDYVIKRTLEELFGVVDGTKNVCNYNTERIWEGIKFK